jgi:hypothetical protein
MHLPAFVPLAASQIFFLKAQGFFVYLLFFRKCKEIRELLPRACAAF